MHINWLTARPADDGAVQAVKSIAAEYAEENPGFSLTVEAMPDRPSYLQRVRILASSNELPEWFDADPEPYFQEISDAGLVTDIEAIYDEIGVTDDFFPISIDYPRFDDGTLELMSWNANAEYFWYRKSLFEQAGAEAPTTFDEFLEVSAQLEAAGITPISMDGKDIWPQIRWLAFLPFRATGNEFIDGLRDGSASMTDPAGVATAEFFQEAAGYFQKGWSSTDAGTALDLFTSGEAAILYTGSWDLPSFTDDDGNLDPDIGFFKMPMVDPATDATSPGDFFAHSGIGTAISADADTPAMREFLDYLFERYGNVALYEHGNIPSTLPEIRDDLGQVYVEILEDLNEVDQFAKVWDVRLAPEVVDIMGRQSTSLGLGDITTEGFATSVDDALARNLVE